MSSLNAEKMRQALAALDGLLSRPVELIMGGGGAMLLAYHFPLATSDIDAIPKGLSVDELTPFVEEVARQLGLPLDWLNPWYSSFTYVLAADYETRLQDVFQGRQLLVRALGKEDLLLMKCFAHRPKDRAHARALVRAGANVDLVFEWIEEKNKRKLPQAAAAQEFLEEVLDSEGQ
jgi:hypothetical protein